MKVDKDMGTLVQEMNQLKIHKNGELEKPNGVTTLNEPLFQKDLDGSSSFGLRKVSSAFMDKIRKIRREKVLGKKRGLDEKRFEEDNSTVDRKKLVLVTKEGGLVDLNQKDQEKLFENSESKCP